MRFVPVHSYTCTVVWYPKINISKFNQKLNICLSHVYMYVVKSDASENISKIKAFSMGRQFLMHLSGQCVYTVTHLTGIDRISSSLFTDRLCTKYIVITNDRLEYFLFNLGPFPQGDDSKVGLKDCF